MAPHISLVLCASLGKAATSLFNIILFFFFLTEWVELYYNNEKNTRVKKRGPEMIQGYTA